LANPGILPPQIGLKREVLRFWPAGLACTAQYKTATADCDSSEGRLAVLASGPFI